MIGRELSNVGNSGLFLGNKFTQEHFIEPGAPYYYLGSSCNILLLLAQVSAALCISSFF